MLDGRSQAVEELDAMIANNHAALVEQDSRQLHPMYHPTRTANAAMVERGDGVWLYTTDGKKILDSMASLWNVNIGYGNRELAQVAYEQMLDIAYSSGFAGMTNPPSALLADKLAGFFRPNMNFTNFTSGGSESSDTSFKTARYYWHLRGRSEKTKDHLPRERLSRDDAGGDKRNRHEQVPQRLRRRDGRFRACAQSQPVSL